MVHGNPHCQRKEIEFLAGAPPFVKTAFIQE
jgi:hypothetical protein